MDYMGPSLDTDYNDRVSQSAFYNYSEPFSAECRAFGRLKEAGHEELVVKCFGYLLLDEKHERAMMSQFNLKDTDFNGTDETPGDDYRQRFLGKGDRLPPIRSIVKELGQNDDRLRNRDARRILRDVVKLQQLGIVCLDVAHRQLINGKLADLSTAVTTPHYLINPELRAPLTPELISAVEYDTFQLSMMDYWYFDDMVQEWNWEHDRRGDQVSVTAYPGGYGCCRLKEGLRRTPERDRVYTFVDPRRYDWRTERAVAGRTSGKVTRSGKPKGVSKEYPTRLQAKPPRWYYDCDSAVAAKLKKAIGCGPTLKWDYVDGLFVPKKWIS